MKLRAGAAVFLGLMAVRVIAADSAATKNVRIDLDAQAQPAPQSSAAAKSAPTAKEATTLTPTPLTTPGKAAPVPKNAKPAKKADKPGKIDGVEVARGGERGFLGIKVENNTWVVSFYDQKKKPVAADVASIALRWPVQYQPNPERALLTPTGDGKVMSSEKTVRPPFNYRLYLTLLKDPSATDQPAETYVVDFHQ